MKDNICPPNCKCLRHTNSGNHGSRPCRKGCRCGRHKLGGCKRGCACFRHRKAEASTTAKATVRPTLRQIEWAAGFIEGEGHFSARNSGVSVTACQLQTEPLKRLLRYFGGRVTPRSRPDRIGVWAAYGTRARGIMMTLYALMSPKRQRQIRKALRA